MPTRYAENHVHHGNRRVQLAGGGRFQKAADPFRFVLDDFAPVHYAWLSWLDPGGFITPHRDAGPWRERWQIPIHAAGCLDESGDQSVPVDGVPFRVRHWDKHSVWNVGDQPRIHIVLDRDVWLDLPPAPFATFPIPAEFAALVDAAR